MSVLRTLLMAFLLVTLMPWGAHLRAMPEASAGLVGVAATSDAGAQVPAAQPHTVQKPAIKCRRGLPGSPCPTEAKAVIPTVARDGPPSSRLLPFDAPARLPDGRPDRPALPPPRLA